MKGAQVKRDAREDALAAGFFDALIGNQDRHAGQFRYDESAGALGLLDHGFSFPVERALCRGAYFQAFRRQEHPLITDHERELLRWLLDDPEVRDIEVLDVESGQTVTYDADPERWARNLPHAFRSGDVVCHVTDEASEAAARDSMAARA